jgi:2-keto-4-pentenoate hydratase
MPTPAELAHALGNARHHGQSLDATQWASTIQNAAHAYEVQDAVREAIDASAPAAVWKSGGPSRTAVLTHAALLRASVLGSGAVVAPLASGRRIVEAEIALKLGRDITPADAAQLTHENAAACISAFAPAIEIVDSRWQQGNDCAPLLKLADHQSNGALVIGDFVPYRAVDWSAQVCTLTLGSSQQDFTGTHSLGEPTWLLPIWLRHATRNGHTVAAGTVVTTGTWCGLMPVAAGTQVTARFQGIGEVSVRLA